MLTPATTLAAILASQASANACLACSHDVAIMAVPLNATAVVQLLLL